MSPIRTLALSLAAIAAFAADVVDPAKFVQPPTASWPTYNGDYSGRRFSPLNKITSSNIQSLSLAWVYRMNTGPFGGGSIKATPLLVDGIMYLTFPDHVWAIGARSGPHIGPRAW